ncbi:DUF881 domain-containing protein [Streptomyces olivoreticuli]|uniref:DUF881 domain-containing protein n=1 Tax=Streptomyces olivoreticuli TaxID=68246 RepID=UPI001F07A1A3|nr:DUF881 domain-containing protein [Streptomyces olivoreticuli]
MSSDDTPEEPTPADGPAKAGEPGPKPEPDKPGEPGKSSKPAEPEKAADEPGEAAASAEPVDTGEGRKDEKPDEATAPEPEPVSPPEPEPAPPSGPEAPSPSPEGAAEAKPLTGRQRLLNGLWPPRLTRAQLTVAVLLCVLGLGLAIQVRSTSDNSALRGARQEDLVRILDELDNRTKRLEDEKRRLESQRTELESSSNQAAEARKQTAQKEQQLAVLAGTVAAQGPGIELTVSDPKGSVEPDKLLDTIQELRAAGAEAIQINDVRVTADTYFSGAAGKVEIDGKKVSQPYRFKVIGKPQDLEPALNIPGGVVQTLEKEQAGVSVNRSEKIIVDALRPAKRPDYARSSS